MNSDLHPSPCQVPFAERQELFYALSTFLRALSHKIRTPLSVIANELVVLGSGNDAESIEVLQEKVSQSSAILKAATIPGGAELKSRPVLMGQLLGEVFEREFPDLPKAVIECDPDRMIFALQGVRKLIERFYSEIQLRVERLQGVTILELQSGTVRETVEPFQTLSQWISHHRGQEDTLPGLCDLIFFCEGARLQVLDSGKGVRIRMGIG